MKEDHTYPFQISLRIMHSKQILKFQLLAVGAIHFEDRFCTSRKGGMGEVDGHINAMPQWP